MPDLIAQGASPENRWRRKLEPSQRYVIGRTAGQWSTPWDERVSRKHAQIVYREGRLFVEALPGARNPIFYRGHKSESFNLQPGDHFVIGKTMFSLIDERVDVSVDMPEPAGERTFSLDELRRQPFREADKRIDVLSRLPEIISGSATDEELVVRLVNLLLGGIARATAAAVVAVMDDDAGTTSANQSVSSSGPPESAPQPAVAPEPATATLPTLPGGAPRVDVLHWDRRQLNGSDFRPSERLIRQAIDRRESVAHVWSPDQTRSRGEFTVSEGLDWAFCTPVGGRACAGWALYVTGSLEGEFENQNDKGVEMLRDEVKFAELTAATLSALRESRLLATRQASLSQFFSPVVLDALAMRDADEALAPREADVTVLFCDLRGFTQQSERSAGDLFDLLQRVSQALGVMTHHILAQGGVVGDFHGDAAMGFWGWPIAQPDAVERACRAAQGIRAAFTGGGPTGSVMFGSARRAAFEGAAVAATGPAPLSGSALVSGSQLVRDYLGRFRVGIGIASGRAVAGKIGTVDQVKVTVFGPVVNLASRLETMTKQLRASILIDPPTAAVIRASVPQDVCRVRRLVRVRPVGISTPLEVSELLPPLPTGEVKGEGGVLTCENIATYEAALDAFQARDWALALKHLHNVPPDDVAKDFLTMFIVQHGRTPPPNWDGSIPLESK